MSTTYRIAVGGKIVAKSTSDVEAMRLYHQECDKHRDDPDREQVALVMNGQVVNSLPGRNSLVFVAAQ